MKISFSGISKSTILRNIATVATGTALSQIIVLLFSPLLSRIFSPEAFGLLGVLMSLLLILNPIVALGYPISIVLPNDDFEAIKLMIFSIITSVLTSFLTLVALMIFSSQIESLLKNNDISPYLIFVPLIMLSSGLIQTFTQWMIRKKYFKLYSSISVIQSTLTNTMKYGFGFYFPFFITLLLITVGGSILEVFISFFSVRSSIKESIRLHSDKLSIKEVIATGKKYKEFPLFRLPEQLINGISQSLPSILLGIFFGVASVGFYQWAKKFLDAPVQLIGKSIGDVLYPKFSEQKATPKILYQSYIKATMSLVLLGVIPFTLFFIFSPLLFNFVFGSSWFMAGYYARWLSVWVFLTLCNIPSIRLIPVLKLQRFLLIFTISNTLAKVIAIVTSYYYWNNELFVIGAFSITAALMNIILILFINYKAKIYNGGVFE